MYSLKILVGTATAKLVFKDKELMMKVLKRYSAFKTDREEDITINVRTVNGLLNEYNFIKTDYGPDDLILIRHRYGKLKIDKDFNCFLTIFLSPKYLLLILDRFMGLIFEIYYYINQKGLLLHASAVIHNDGVLIFAGPGGEGKSTIAKKFPKNNVLNDDSVILTDGYCYATPFSSWGGFNNNLSGKISKIFFIKQSKKNSVKQLTFFETIPHLFKNIFLFRTLNEENNKLVGDNILLDKIQCFFSIVKSFKEIKSYKLYLTKNNNLKNLI